MTIPLYKQLPADLKQQLEQAVDKGLAASEGEVSVFFRADDIARPSAEFSRLIEIFIAARLPLCLAVVPSWLTPENYRELLDLTGTTTGQWCFHQHGWQHTNHETSGKKQEFGPGRTKEDQVKDLAKGKQRLQDIMGSSFSPFFTPPWNRCSRESMDGLLELEFKAISRSSNTKPESPACLPDIAINTDLHTRKEQSGDESLHTLLCEITAGIAGGRSGVMLHHQLMNSRAFDFLSTLLDVIRSRPALRPVTFPDLI